MFILYDPNSAHTFSSTSGQSWIDLVLYVEHNKFEKIQIWDTAVLSNHNFITYSLIYKKKNIRMERFLNINDIDQWKFRVDLHNILEINLLSYANNIQITKEIATDGKNLLKSNRTRKFKQKTSAPWWNNDLDFERSHVRIARRRFQNECEINKRNEYMII